MTGGALALVLAAAVLHAGWNALAKRGTDPLAFLALCSCVAAPVLVPLAAPMLWRDGLPARAVPFVLGTIALHVLYFYALGRAYSSGAYSVVYPIARGLGGAPAPGGVGRTHGWTSGPATSSFPASAWKKKHLRRQASATTCATTSISTAPTAA